MLQESLFHGVARQGERRLNALACSPGNPEPKFKCAKGSKVERIPGEAVGVEAPRAPVVFNSWRTARFNSRRDPLSGETTDVRSGLATDYRAIA